MFSKAVVVIFLAVALSSSAAQAMPGRPHTSSLTSSTAAVTPTGVSNSKDVNKSNGNNGKGSSKTGNVLDGQGNNNGNNTAGCVTNGNDPQTSCTLNSGVLATGFESDGQETPTAGQVASLTSTNNFINFCLTVNKPITNGQQIKTGSCNPAPMGVIASTSNMPSSKFVFPPNLGTVKANTQFTIKMAINNLEAGNFVNADQNYYAAPQQINAQGNVVGHTHFVIQAIDSLQSTKTLDPQTFAFFKGVNTAADADGTVSVPVPSGLPAGTYRLASINTAANHQPVLVAVAQHGSLDDQVYFTVNADGNAANPPGSANNGQANNAASSDSSSTASPTNPPANGKHHKGNKSGNNGSDTTASPTPSSSTPPSQNKAGSGKVNEAVTRTSSCDKPQATRRSFEIRRDTN
jgi:hypothetical protein